MKSNFSLDDLYLFHLLVQHQGMNAAAAASGIPPATLSRRLKRLEQSLGCRLLDRNAHRFTLTEIGQQYYLQCQPLLTDLQTVTGALNSEQHSLQGKLEITAPVNMAQHWLKDCFFAFNRQYPEIQLEIVLSNQLESLVDQRFDAAFRLGEPHVNNWIARHVSTTHMGLCASTEYVQQSAPLQHPRDLINHRLILVDPTVEWDLRNLQTGEEYLLDPLQPEMRTNDFNLAVDAMKSGIGLSLIPSYYFTNPNVSSSQLVSVLPEWQGRCRRLYLLYRDLQTISARLRAFIDFVVVWMEAEREKHPQSRI